MQALRCKPPSSSPRARVRGRYPYCNKSNTTCSRHLRFSYNHSSLHTHTHFDEQRLDLTRNLTGSSTGSSTGCTDSEPSQNSQTSVDTEGESQVKRKSNEEGEGGNHKKLKISEHVYELFGRLKDTIHGRKNIKVSYAHEVPFPNLKVTQEKEVDASMSPGSTDGESSGDELQGELTVEFSVAHGLTPNETISKMEQMGESASHDFITALMDHLKKKDTIDLAGEEVRLRNPVSRVIGRVQFDLVLTDKIRQHLETTKNREKAEKAVRKYIKANMNEFGVRILGLGSIILGIALDERGLLPSFLDALEKNKEPLKIKVGDNADDMATLERTFELISLEHR